MSRRKHSLFEPSFANAEIRTGDGQLSPLQFSPLSSKNKFNGWDSRSKPAQIPVPCETGASVTAIDAMCRNGCWVHGESMCTRLSAAQRHRAESDNCGVRPEDQSLEHSRAPGRAKCALALRQQEMCRKRIGGRHTKDELSHPGGIARFLAPVRLQRLDDCTHGRFIIQE